MASRTRAADDFATIRAARDKILKDEAAAGNSTSVVVSPSSSTAPQKAAHAADDFAEIAKHKRTLGRTGDIAYPKDKVAKLEL